MGNIVGKAMDENLKKNQEFMLKTQQLQLERQLAMQNEIRERQMAAMIAKSRDVFWFYTTFETLFSTGLTLGALRTKRYSLLVPIIPLSFIFAYQWDLAYGSKLTRIREMADRIIDEEHHLLELPHGLPTFSSVEAARLAQKKNQPFKPGHDIFL
ncbi:plasminogen receptor (KT) [Biomphalaria glabrata]|uniref:Plasminogen receptor (KT)-like n=1 Tax=Biomphalaria glabrata TaxID=6526 RepID=A0A9W3AGJ0_BIOGL|nr:plasminogen receptor (KT)-like [Biomphalaria glabrata]XP_055886416.1 plasminogen receptor (KT)-like [Biomphalaria glabrata]KAI8754606.1 plasminogen receptor (KT)-like [Biomphalaria glabrata]KAI8773234.1 plasminogen receptor (KT) [Biomphalaria glabrata]